MPCQHNTVLDWYHIKCYTIDNCNHQTSTQTTKHTETKRTRELRQTNSTKKAAKRLKLSRHPTCTYSYATVSGNCELWPSTPASTAVTNGFNKVKSCTVVIHEDWPSIWIKRRAAACTRASVPSVWVSRDMVDESWLERKGKL